MDDLPELANGPVILIHLVSEKDSDVAECCAGRWVKPKDSEYPNTPRVLCPMARVWKDLRSEWGVS